ncbi:MAG: hypothetical protein LBN00_02375 [Oscillospiraceae bacterium]|jgi:hypothetical protein|nr:hypothetical protein [Oscillospiraceae bacterium]
MTISEKYEALIASLRKLTNSGKLSWLPISKALGSSLGNNNFESYLIEYNRYIYAKGNNPIIEEYSSLFATIEQGNVYLLRFTKQADKYFIIAVQNAHGKILELNNDLTLQNELAGLYDFILEQQTESKNIEYIDQIIALTTDDD